LITVRTSNMGTSTEKTVGFGAGQDPAMLEANRVYQEALAKLTQSLDTRKNRFFDPILLAAAQGFGAPTQTGGFGESLGIAAKNVGAAQEQELKLEQEIAQQRVAAAGKGVELQRMRARDADIAKYLGADQPADPVAGPLSAPGAGAKTAGPLTTSATAGPSMPVVPDAATAAPVKVPSVIQAGALPALAPAVTAQAPQGVLPVAGNRGYDGGIQISPPIEGSIKTLREYVQLNRNSGKSLFDLQQEWQEIQRKNLDVRDNFVYNKATGKMDPTKAAFVEIPIFGEDYGGKTFTVPESVALELSVLQRQGDAVGYKALADKFTGKSFSGNAPASKEDRALAAKEAETRAAKLGESSAAKEAGAEDTDSTARRIYGSVTRVADYLKQSPNYFGIFARPGITAAIGNLIKEGIQTPSGSLNLAGFEDSVRKLMPGVTQRDLDNVTKAATELAEIELAFTRLYLAKQGAVTEGERKIVRAIPGTTSTSPEVLRSRMELLKARSQYDIDVVDAWRQWQDKNPGRSYLEFERKSDLYKDIKKNFAEETETIFGGIKAVPTSQRARPATGNPNLDAAKKRLEEKLK
jgi:hypothetical protein